MNRVIPLTWGAVGKCCQILPNDHFQPTGLYPHLSAMEELLHQARPSQLRIGPVDIV